MGNRDAGKKHASSIPCNTLFLLLSLFCLATLLFFFISSSSSRSSISATSSFGIGSHDRDREDPGKGTSCNYSDGIWIRNPNPMPNRYDNTCKEIFKGWNCISNRKSNAWDLLQWRWQPNSCDLPTLDPVRFLHRYRNTNIGFVGDSLNRNMFVSLVCTLKRVSPGEVKKWRPAGADRGFTFLNYNLTLAYHRTNLLVQYGGQPVLMGDHWNPLGTNKAIGWMLMFLHTHGKRLHSSMIFLSSIQDTGGGHHQSLTQFSHQCSSSKRGCQCYLLYLLKMAWIWL